ncbi:U3 small nucleolar RNA-associated protein 25 [Zostera marina]|uniref:U3 small nucleolar RNA-associated protein 25 n=1 Tax=Zostera marina TaxID=29655 RepID=A0A0K9PNU2_ZOSMR|nr:U3 small nucleolar RNA-associated protein 25 [Zostera marina]
MPFKKELDNNPRKRHQSFEKPRRNQSPSSSETSSDEPSSTIIAQESLYNQESCFEHLLSALGSSDEPYAQAYKRRMHITNVVESINESEEAEITESSVFCHIEDLDADSGTTSSDRGQTEGNSPSQLIEDRLEDILEPSDSYIENSTENNEAVTLNYSINKSNFHCHLNHVLTKTEVDELMRKIWKYKWEMPIFYSSTSKWKGTVECFQEDDGNDIYYGLKVKLYNNWLDLYKESGGDDFSSSRQRHFFSIFNTYLDVMHCNKKGFYAKGGDEDSSIMDAYIMHILNHVYRTRTLVTKNDAKLSKNQEQTEMLHGGAFLDRGFTRPKALILLPFRSIAFHVVKRLIQLTPSSNRANVENFDRFSKEFGAANEKDEGDNEVLPNGAKPADFKLLFSGNISQEFMIGIKFTKKNIKLYNDFYSSDLIVASPVQLVQEIGKAEAEKGKDVDYLSSIELLIIDHADIITMQNWSHLNSVLEKMNEIPSEQHISDVMRIRPWYLDGHVRFYRQTILLGSFQNQDINATFNNLCLNYKGKIKSVSDHKGVLPKILLPMRQVFKRLNSSIVDADEDRFSHFSKEIFPKIKDSLEGGIMIFISCYFQFLRIRNFLRAQNASFCLLGEYTKQADISRARGWFFDGKKKIMLYTERAHFYHRYKIRGIRNLIFYSLPERKEFYPEVLNMVDGAKSMSCSVIFSQLDTMRLERIVGSTSSKKMLTSDKDIFVFC